MPNHPNQQQQSIKMSIASESSSYDQAMALVADLPFADMLRFNAELATLLKKMGKTGTVGKAAKKEKKEKDPDAPKKKASSGVRAWNAFIKHCQETMPDRFEDAEKKRSEQLAIVKAIRAENEEAYNEFVKTYKEEHPDVSEDEAEAEEEEKPVVKKPKMTAEEKKAEINAKAAERKAAKKEEKPEAKKPIAKKEVKKVEKKPAKKVEVEEEESDMPKKDIDGVEYHWDPHSNGLWAVADDGSMGNWVGYYEPDDEKKPIRYTESPSDE